MQLVELNIRKKLRDLLRHPFEWVTKLDGGGNPIPYVDGVTTLQDNERLSDDGMYVEEVGNTPLRIPSVQKLLGDRPLFEFIDVSHTELSYFDIPGRDDLDFPRINLVFQGEVNNKLTIDSRLKSRQFPMSISIYFNQFFKEDKPVRASACDAVSLLDALELAALEVDYNMHNDVVNELENITLFDLSSVNYDIDAQSSGITGVAQMQYQIHYVLNYDQVTEPSNGE